MAERHFLRKIWSEFAGSKASLYGAGACFYLIVSILPTTMLLLALTPHVPVLESLVRELLRQLLPQALLPVAAELLEPLMRMARMITDEVLHVLEETSPELVGDIAVNGITLTGGGSQIWGMDKLITERTAIPCSLADDPDSCVVYGCGKSLSWINTMTEGPINLARKRIMRE